MTAPAWRGAAALLGLLVLSGVQPIAARGSTEEFANFDVERQEEDDESLVDHLLTRTPRAWQNEWERAPQALRTAQGCLTSGQWFLVTQLKLSSAVGRRARFGVNLDQSESDETTYDNLDLSIRFPTRYGTPGAMFRPLHDKSRQDFALMWEAGADTLAYHVETRFTFEDLFNNLWAFRQTRVGNASEPYERHPWEPALRVALRQQRWRGEIEGRFLTGSRKRVAALEPGEPDRIGTLWGTWAAGSVELNIARGTLQARGTNRQAVSTDQPADLSSPDARNFRRQWQGELAWIAPVRPGLETEARVIYQARSQRRGPPVREGRFEAIDRTFQLEALWHATPSLSTRLGGLYDRITVPSATAGGFSHGTRTESRAYIGLSARFGRVSVSVVECIELDPEPYPVWLVHDKGFFHLQASF